MLRAASLPMVTKMLFQSILGIFVSPFKYFPKADKQPSVLLDVIDFRIFQKF